MPFIKDPTFYDIQKIRNNMHGVAKTTEEKLDAVKKYLSEGLQGIVAKYSLAMTAPEKAKIMKNLKVVQDILKKPNVNINEANLVEKQLNVINKTTYQTTKPVNRESVNENIRTNLKKIFFADEVFKMLNTKRSAELEIAAKAKAAAADSKGKTADEDEDDEMFFLESARRPVRVGKKRKSRRALWLALVLLIVALAMYIMTSKK
jgi:hypothetical protein